MPALAADLPEEVKANKDANSTNASPRASTLTKSQQEKGRILEISMAILIYTSLSGILKQAGRWAIVLA